MVRILGMKGVEIVLAPVAVANNTAFSNWQIT